MDTVLSQVQSLGLRIKSFNISDLRKTLSFESTFLQAENVLQRSPPEKGAWHGAVIAVFLQWFQSWRRYTTETESANCEKKTSPDGKLLNHPTKELAVRGNSSTVTALPNKVKRLYCGMRWSAPPTLISNWLACSNYQLDSVLLSTYWLVKHINVCARWAHETGLAVETRLGRLWRLKFTKF